MTNTAELDDERIPMTKLPPLFREASPNTILRPLTLCIDSRCAETLVIQLNNFIDLTFVLKWTSCFLLFKVLHGVGDDRSLDLISACCFVVESTPATIISKRSCAWILIDHFLTFKNIVLEVLDTGQNLLLPTDCITWCDRTRFHLESLEKINDHDHRYLPPQAFVLAARRAWVRQRLMSFLQHIRVILRTLVRDELRWKKSLSVSVK